MLLSILRFGVLYNKNYVMCIHTLWLVYYNFKSISYTRHTVNRYLNKWKSNGLCFWHFAYPLWGKWKTKPPLATIIMAFASCKSSDETNNKLFSKVRKKFWPRNSFPINELIRWISPKRSNNGKKSFKNVSLAVGLDWTRVCVRKLWMCNLFGVVFVFVVVENSMHYSKCGFIPMQ